MSAAPAAADAGARSPPRSRHRGRLLVFVALLVLLLLAALSIPWWLDARRVAGLALAQADAATGLDWSFDGEPELRWRPQPWLALPGLAARDGQGRVVLAAERLELALPWSTLRGESLRIEALRIKAPVIDVEAALEAWNARAEGDIAALPVLEGLLLSDGRLHWRGTGIDQIQLSLPRFKTGEPMALEVSGRAPFGFRIELAATPQIGPLRLEALRLSLSGDGPMPEARLNGRLQFAPWQLQAEGELAAWPSGWPPLPAPLDATAPLRFDLAQAGGSAMDSPARLRLSMPGASAEAEAQPRALLDWWRSTPRPHLPPLRLQARSETLEFDGLRLDGVQFEIEEAGAAEAGRAE